MGGGRWRPRGAAGGRRGWPPKPATALRLATATYAALLAAVTLLPIQWDPWRVSYPNEDHTPQLVPLRGSGTNPFQSSHPLHMLGEQVGNILLFLPFGVLLPLLWPQLNRWWRVMALGVGTSIGIELAQMAMAGVHRADVNDVLLNALGRRPRMAHPPTHPAGSGTPTDELLTSPSRIEPNAAAEMADRHEY